MGKSCVLLFFFFFLMFSPRSYIQQRRTKITETWKSGSKTARPAKKRKLLDFIYLFVYEGKVNSWLIKDVLCQAPFQMSAKCWGRYVLRESQVLKLTLHIEPLDSSFSQKCPPDTLQIIYFSPQCHKSLLRSHILPIVMSSHATVSPFNSALQWSSLLCTVSKETNALLDQLQIWRMTTTHLHVVGKQLPIWRICHQMSMLFLLFVQSLINIVTLAFREHVTSKVLESWIQSAHTFQFMKPSWIQLGALATNQIYWTFLLYIEWQAGSQRLQTNAVLVNTNNVLRPKIIRNCLSYLQGLTNRFWHPASSELQVTRVTLQMSDSYHIRDPKAPS